MTISSELLKDYIAGKLSPDEASGITNQIAGDPDLAAYVEDQRAALQAALGSPAGLWQERVKERIAAKSASWIPAAMMAVGIGLGVLLAGSFGIGSDLRSQDGALIAQGELAQMLSATLAADARNSATAARVAASFWSKNGSFCRIFVTRANAESALSGIACRERRSWRIAAMATMAPIDTPQLPLAALPASVRSVMDNLIVGQPLDADAERQARNQDWRVR